MIYLDEEIFNKSGRQVDLITLRKYYKKKVTTNNPTKKLFSSFL